MNSTKAPPSDLQAEIISIGTELLLGEITDTNASWIAGQLPALGIPVYRVSATGDNRARLTSLLREGWERANLLVLTGGLGPTEDDVTREAIADLLSEEMVVVPELERTLRAWFSGRGRAMPERNVKQATVIASAEVLANPIGTAPGWWVAHDGRYIATMPGVPVEMRRMWREQVVPRLHALPRGGVIVKRTLKVLGMGESAVEEALGELVRSLNPTVATYAKSDGIHVRLGARATDETEAQALLEAMETQVRGILGEHIYGMDEESIAQSTARLLTVRGLRLAAAEAGLRGAFCRELAAEGFAGGLVLPPAPVEAARETVEAEAIALARRARDAFKAQVGVAALSVPTPSGSTLLAAAVCGVAGEASRVEEHRTEADDARRRAALLGLQVLRQVLQSGS